ncbi:MAG: GIY-YIG nuclease family protein [Phycisphaerae bacterium]|nr:GIY-YIG nuclease family protein [Phycisphaerae bacterium]
MYQVYLLKSLKNNSLYIGYTKDLNRRLEEHNAGLAEYTRKYLPWTLIYYESYLSLEDAKKREKSLKHFGKAYSQLKKRIAASLKKVE